MPFKEFDEMRGKALIDEQINEFVEKEKVKITSVHYTVTMGSIVRGGQVSAPELYQVLISRCLVQYEPSRMKSKASFGDGA